jgi:hypothetical protein
MKNTRKLWLPLLVLALVIGGLAVVLKAPDKPSDTESNNTTNNTDSSAPSVTQLPEPGNASSVKIDFAACAPGQVTVAFASGSTRFDFTGKSGDTCIFLMGTEIENPNADRALDTTCNVPTSEGERTFSVSQNGIDFAGLSDKYCTVASKPQ